MNAVQKIARPTTDIWTLASVRRIFISVQESSFWTYVTDALTSMNVRYVGKALTIVILICRKQ